jgi:hypothetical protein
MKADRTVVYSVALMADQLAVCWADAWAGPWVASRAEKSVAKMAGATVDVLEFPWVGASGYLSAVQMEWSSVAQWAALTAAKWVTNSVDPLVGWWVFCSVETSVALMAGAWADWTDVTTAAQTAARMVDATAGLLDNALADEMVVLMAYATAACWVGNWAGCSAVLKAQMWAVEWG